MDAVRDVADRIRLTAPESEPAPARQVLRTAGDAVLSRTVLSIEYVDRHGTASHRLIEPVELLGAGRQWYLVGWCRLRQEVRGFRLDRMRQAAATDEIAPRRSLDQVWQAGLDLPATRLRLPGGADSSIKADRMVSGPGSTMVLTRSAPLPDDR
jgi:predicted DNA-binding transcriptional regulator YafY